MSKGEFKGKKSIRSPSDWIVFLQGEITYTISFMFPLYTSLLIIYIALVQINQSIGNKFLPTGITEIALALLFLLFVPAFLIIWEIKPISILCKKIIKGELTVHEDILKEYEKIEKRNKLFWRKNR